MGGWIVYMFFNDTATTDIYTYLHTLSLHDALPIYPDTSEDERRPRPERVTVVADPGSHPPARTLECGCGAFQRSEEHTSELQSLMCNSYAVFRLQKKHKNGLVSNYIAVDIRHCSDRPRAWNIKLLNSSHKF